MKLLRLFSDINLKLVCMVYMNQNKGELWEKGRHHKATLTIHKHSIEVDLYDQCELEQGRALGEKGDTIKVP